MRSFHSTANAATAAALVCALLSPVAHAATELVAIGQLDATQGDRALRTAAPLENGARGNLLGGIGSGFAWAGGYTFLALPDRGPNAIAYNAPISDTASYIPRFHQLQLHLWPNRRTTALPFTLQATLLSTTLLHASEPLAYGTGSAYGVPDGAPALNRSYRTHFFSGRSDNYAPGADSSNPDNARLDPEGIRVSADGRSVYISDEYGPYVYRFDRATGERTRAYALPATFAAPHPDANGDDEIEANASGRVANKGMEGLAISPDGSTLYGAMQSPLAQDGGTDGATLRIVRIDTATGATTQYAYPLTNIGSDAKPKYPTVSEIVAINDHAFLVDERDGKGFGDGSTAKFKRLFRVDLDNATPVDDVTDADALAARAVPKTLFLDIVAALGAHGIAPDQVPAKIEGVAFGPDVFVAHQRRHTLFVATDNDFLATVDGKANPNMIYVFAVDPADLPDYAPQQFGG